MTNHRIVDEFPKTSINRRAGDIWEAAARGHVSLSDHGKSRFVIMSRPQYDDMMKRSDPRAARATADIPADEAEQLNNYLQDVLADDE